MKHLIWSNMNLNVEEWRDDILEYHPDLDDDEVYEMMVRMNWEYLGDERINLNKDVAGDILIIADIGRWNGRYSGYREMNSRNIADCLYLDRDCDYGEWWVEDGDMRGVEVHHDGRNYMRYRAWKPGVDHDDLLDKLYEGTATEDDVQKYTVSIAPYVCKVYGWEL